MLDLILFDFFLYFSILVVYMYRKTKMAIISIHITKIVMSQSMMLIFKKVKKDLLS